MPLPQSLEKWEPSSPSTHIYFPPRVVSKPYVSPKKRKKERVMKIYYMCVQMKRGVAILRSTKKGIEPPTKKPRIEEMTYPEKVHTKVALSYISTKDLLTDSESSLDSEVPEEKGKVDNPAESPASEESPRAQTPEWLVALDSGFRCMACCRVFPSLEVLQKHVENGVSEGFSCYAFHFALTWLKNKGNRKGKKNKRKKKQIRKKTSRCNKKKTF
ncbi:protein FAM170A [Tupaia chinensis]|uniref:protein FAM170A n=1 Tax=Tupaia chinensis TaxID=246437 RepID=UPI0003C908CA|nr:protein FAM170A [Tupaia chinensis]